MVMAKSQLRHNRVLSRNLSKYVFRLQVWIRSFHSFFCSLYRFVSKLVLWTVDNQSKTYQMELIVKFTDVLTSSLNVILHAIHTSKPQTILRMAQLVKYINLFFCYHTIPEVSHAFPNRQVFQWVREILKRNVLNWVRKPLLALKAVPFTGNISLI